MIISCGGVVINSDMKVLVLQKKNGYFCLPKGRVESGETWEMAALREVKEETNIDARIIQYIGAISYVMNAGKGKRYNKTVKWFLMEPLSFDLRPQKSEGFVSSHFVSREESQGLLAYDNERYIVRKAFKFLKENA